MICGGRAGARRDLSTAFVKENEIVLHGPLGAKELDEVKGVFYSALVVLFPQMAYTIREGFLLRNGKLCYSAKKLAGRRVSALASVTDETTIYCSPFTAVARRGKFIDITIKMPTIPFHSITSPNSKMITRSLSLLAANDETALEWVAIIEREISSLRLSSKIKRDTFNDLDYSSILNKALWSLVLFGNQNLLTFFTSCVTRDSEGKIIDRRDEKSCIFMFDQLHTDIREMFSGSESLPVEYVVAYVLDRVTTSTFDRAFMLMVDLTPGAVADFRGGDSLRDATLKLSEREELSNIHQAIFDGKALLLSPRCLFFHVILSAFEEPLRFAKYIRYTILVALEHPATATGTADDFESRIFSGSDWTKDIEWFARMKQRRRRGLSWRIPFDVNGIDLMLESPLWFLHKLLLDAVDNVCNGGSDVLIKALVSLPRPVLILPFKTSNRSGESTGPHLARILLEPNLLVEDRVNITTAILSGGQASNELFRVLVKEGLTTGHLSELFGLVVAHLFDKELNIVANDFSPAYLQYIHQAPIIILDELLLMMRNGDEALDGDFYKELLLLALRFEDWGGRLTSSANSSTTDVTTITNWVVSKSKIETEVAMKEVDALLKALIIDRFLRDKVNPFAQELFGDMPELSPTASAPPMPPVPPTLSEYSSTGTNPYYDNSHSTLPSTPPLPSTPTHPSPIEERKIDFINYNESCIGDTIHGLLSVCLTVHSDCFNAFVKRVGPEFFKTFFSPTHGLRGNCLTTIFQKLSVCEPLKKVISSGKLLNEDRHFTWQALELLGSSLVATDIDMQCRLITISLKLEDYNDLNNRIKVLTQSVAADYTAKTRILTKILNAADLLTAEDFRNVTLEDLLSCVNIAATAISLLRGSNSSLVSHLSSLFDYFLRPENKPQSWCVLFKSAITIAIFIKYMFRDDLEKAYGEFRLRNPDNELFERYFSKVRYVLPNPISTNEELKAVMKDGSFSDAVSQFLVRLENKYMYSDENLKVAVSMSITWMRIMVQRVGIPMAPRNTQLITLIMCALFEDSVAKKTSGKMRCLVAQVGTGEGKSLIIAMMAAYFVIKKKKNVHVLENNIALLEKDYEQFQDFYRALGVTSSKKFPDERSAIGVTYCLRRDIEHYYREGIFAGRKPFADTIIIVDEVDDLIIDKNPNQSYVKAVTTEGTKFEDYVRLLLSGSTAVPRHRNGFNYAIWKIAEGAVRDASHKVERRDYKVYSDRVAYLSDGDEYENMYSPWLECIRAQRIPGYKPLLLTTFYHQSMPHMMSQYEVIFGLSGSLGSPSEKEFLKETYGAWSFYAPSFLNTCTNFKKPELKLVDKNTVQVYPDSIKQAAAVINMAIANMKNVPVLIITEKHETTVNDLYKQIKKRLAEDGKNGNDLAQILLHYDPSTGLKMPWSSIIDKVTAPVKNTKDRMITITNQFGGRGHDYSVTDEHANDFGGLLVIIMTIPPSEREWIQWKGRTARSDREGQYALILSQTDENIKLEEDLLGRHRLADNECLFRSSLIDDILKLRDRDSKETIESFRIKEGQRINELCDEFYSKFNSTTDTNGWPGTPENQLLSDFLSANKFESANIMNFRTSVSLNYRSKYGI